MRLPETETGEFIPGNPATGRPGSMLTAAYMNSDLREKKGILAAAGITPNPEDDGQLLKAIRYLLDQAIANRPLIFSISNLPTQDRGPIIVAGCAEVWVWTSSAFYTGYRSPLCGRPLDGHTAMPLASEVDAIGGLVLKTGGYAGLWGYAQEQGLVKTEAVWQANRGSHWFSDYSPTQFRLPDLRDMFRRFTGTDADTANARDMGSAQTAAIARQQPTFDASYDGAWRATRSALDVNSSFSGPGTGLYFGMQLTRADINNAGSGWNGTQAYGLRVSPFGGAETRPRNVAYHPRLHV